MKKIIIGLACAAVAPFAFAQTTTTEQTTSESNPALATETSRLRQEELPGDTPDESMPTKKKERRGYQILRIETEGGPLEE